MTKTRTGGRGSGKPHPTDVHVGSRIRLRRTLLGMSQQKLADAIGLTFQQVQKYERGTNRVGASRMLQIAQALDVPVSYFYEEMSQPQPIRDGAGELNPMMKRETLELVRAYYRIANPKVGAQLFKMTKELGRAEA